MPDELLRKYRPVGPPPRLRDRVVEGDPPAWPWAAAAAAMLVVIVGLYGFTERRAARSLIHVPDPVGFEMRVSHLIDALGGDESARGQAVLLATTEELEWRLAAPPNPAAKEEPR